MMLITPPPNTHQRISGPRSRRTFAGVVFYIFSVIMWIAGVVIAKGFWSTLFAIFIPFWSWYLVIERFLLHFKVI